MKKLRCSKTFWLGVTTLVLSILTFVQGEEWVKAYPQTVAGIGTIIGVLTIVIRYFTTQPLQLKVEAGKNKET